MKRNYIRPTVAFEEIEEDLLCGASNPNITGTNTQDYTNDPFGSRDNDIVINDDPLEGGYWDDDSDD